MRVAKVETIPVSVPYTHREVSSQVARDGVSDVLVKLTTDDGLVGWGEACCGADTASVDAAVRAMAPFVIGRDPWNRDAMRRDVPRLGLAAPLRSRTLRDIALEMLEISREGLHRRARRNTAGEDETYFLDPLFTIAGSGRTPAEELLEDFATRWGGNIDPVFTEYAY